MPHDQTPCVIVKGGAFYRPNAQGYTCNIAEAWVLPADKARVYENRDPLHTVLIIPLSVYHALALAQRDLLLKQLVQLNEILTLTGAPK